MLIAITIVVAAIIFYVAYTKSRHNKIKDFPELIDQVSVVADATSQPAMPEPEVEVVAEPAAEILADVGTQTSTNKRPARNKAKVQPVDPAAASRRPRARAKQ
jgi:hypothetical protein